MLASLGRLNDAVGRLSANIVILRRSSSSSYTDVVETRNTQTLDKARERNRDGVVYLTALFDEVIRPLTLIETERFKETVSADNPALFIEIPQRVVHRLISSPLPLRAPNIPYFARNYCEELESLRTRRTYPMTGHPLQSYHTDRDRIATLLARDVNFTASIEGAINTWSALKA